MIVTQWLLPGDVLCSRTNPRASGAGAAIMSLLLLRWAHKQGWW